MRLAHASSESQHPTCKYYGGTLFNYIQTCPRQLQLLSIIQQPRRSNWHGPSLWSLWLDGWKKTNTVIIRVWMMCDMIQWHSLPMTAIKSAKYSIIRDVSSPTGRIHCSGRANPYWKWIELKGFAWNLELKGEKLTVPVSRRWAAKEYLTPIFLYIQSTMFPGALERRANGIKTPRLPEICSFDWPI